MKTSELTPIVEAAVRAPSVRNTQPWRFAVHEGAPGEANIDIFADRSRLLAVADPSARELHISCGAAVEFGRVAARSMALSCRIELLPVPGNPDHLARLVIGEKQRPDASELSLARALSLRYTERGRFDARPVPQVIVERLEHSVISFDAWLKVLDRESDKTATAVLLALADEIENSLPEFEREIARWVRAEPGRSDGIDVYAEAEKLTGRASSFKLRSYGTGGDHPVAETTEPPAPEHPLIALLGTPGDDSYYWLQAGRALARLLLTATTAGVAASPMTQVLEVETTRGLLTRELGLVGYPQVLLRMGFAHGHPESARRPVGDVLVASAPAAEKSGETAPSAGSDA